MSYAETITALRGHISRMTADLRWYEDYTGLGSVALSEYEAMEGIPHRVRVQNLIPGGWIATLANGVEVRIGFTDACFRAESHGEKYWLEAAYSAPGEIVSGDMPKSIDGAVAQTGSYVVAWRREMVPPGEDAAVTEELARLAK